MIKLKTILLRLRIRVVAITMIVLMGSAVCSLGANQVDSLRGMLNTQLSDSSKTEVLSMLAFYLQYSQPRESESLSRQALELAEKINYPKGIAAAYYTLAGANWIMGNYEEAMDHTLKNLRINEQLGDTARIMNARVMLGILNNEQKNYRQALQQFLPVYHYWKKKKQFRRIFNSANNIGAAYFHMESYDSALWFYNTAYDHLKLSGQQNQLALCLNNIGGVYRETGAYDKAINYFNQALQVSIDIDNKRDEAVSYGNLGKAYLLKNDLVSARRTLLEGYAKGKELGSLKVTVDIAEDLYRVEDRSNNPSEALKYHELYVGIKDSLYNKEKLEQINKLETSYQIEKRERELQLKQQQIALLESEKKIQTLWNNIFGLSAVGILILAGVISFYQYQRIRKNRVLYETQGSLSKLELEASKLRENELKQELEYKNKALTSYTVNFIQKGELVEEVKGKIEELKSKDDKLLKSELTNLQKTLNQNYNIDKDWEDFKLYFEQVHEGFFTSLKEQFPALSGSELKLCSLLRMNMNIKEVANVMAISPDSVKTARHRLRKKLDLPSEQNLYDFLLAY